MFQIAHTALVCEKTHNLNSTQSPAYYWEFCRRMAQIKLIQTKIQIVHTPHYEKLLIHIVDMAHICENDIFQIVATWLQFITEK